MSVVVILFGCTLYMLLLPTKPYSRYFYCSENIDLHSVRLTELLWGYVKSIVTTADDVMFNN